MKPIPIYRAAHLLPYVQWLRTAGAPVERGLRQAKLPTLIDDRPDAYLPLAPSIAFLEKMGRSQGIDELGLRAAQQLNMADLSDPLVASVLQSPTLRVALEHFAKLAYLEDSSLRLWISSEKSIAKLCWVSAFPFNPQGLRYDDWSNVLTLLSIARAFLGATWQPNEMAFRSNVPLARFAFEQYQNTHFLIGQRTAWISLPRSFLSLSPRASGDAPGVPRTSSPEHSLHGDAPLLDFPGSLRRVLTPYLPGDRPSIKFAAELAGTSVRTLQRRLQQFGMSFSDVLDQARFEVASTLLRERDTKVIDIAYEVGYEDPAHFTRAFRRLANITPRQYRCQNRLE